MFFAFSSALVIQLGNIQEQIRSASSSHTDMVDLLEKSNNHLLATCGAMRELANYFSIIFVIFVACIFVQAITFSHLAYRIFSGQDSRDIYFNMFTMVDLFRMLFILHIICYKADDLKDEVRTFHK